MIDNQLSSRSDNIKLPPVRYYLLTYTILFASLVLILCNQGLACQASFVDSSALKPSIILILPQSFKIPTGQTSLDDQDQSKLLQYVAVINNVHNEHNDKLLRQQYNKLTLQVRDASSPVTGQLYYEHVFDYFSTDPKGQHLLIPINLDQVSPVQEHGADSRSSKDFTSAVTTHKEDLPLTSANRSQRLIVSIRPYQLDSGFGSENIEFVSSSPIPVESVLTHDGRRSFAIVQTDKPIYKPNDKVRIRAIVVNENLRPVTKDEYRLQVRNPHKIIVEEIRVPVTSNLSDPLYSKQSDPLYLDHVFEFPPEPMFGSWSVHIAHSDPIANDTTSFEVREYVPPSYGIEFESLKYILPSTQTIIGSIYAKYHHGRPVQGKVQFKFGYKDSPSSKPRYVARSTIKDVNSTTGRVDYKINTTKFQEAEWFPNIAGSHFVVEATVTEMSTGHREVSEDSSCIFLSYPYRFSFEDSIEIFKPGLSQQLTVRVLEMQTDKPAPVGSRIIVQYVDQNGTILNRLLPNESFNEMDQKLEDEAFTDSHGKATFNIGPLNYNITWMQATFKYINSTRLHKIDMLRKTSSSISDRLKSGPQTNFNELALGQHGLSRHESKGGWISIMNKSNTEVRVGDTFTSDVSIRDAVIVPNKIFYLIASRGQIVALDTLDSDGLIRFVVSDSMIPSIRLVLFALNSGSAGLLSDSIRIQVEQNLDCGLKIDYESNSPAEANKPYFQPNSKGKLFISARQGDLVSLIGVDSSVYSLNNRSHFDASRIIQRIKRLDLGCGFGDGVNDLDVFHNSGLMLFEQVTNQDSDSLSSQLGSLCMTVLNQLKHLEDLQHGYSRPMFSAASQHNRPSTIGYLANLRNHMGRLSRSKRDIDIEPVINRYKNPMYRACCRLGTLEDLPQQRNCTVRASIVHKYVRQRMDLRTCSAIYYDCCRIVFREEVLLGSIVATRAIPQQSAPNLYTQLPNIGQLDKVEAETLIRKDFRETWLFELVDITQPDGSASLDVQLPHSITQWSVSAMALNRFKPMCIMPQSFKMISFQDIHIRLPVPYRIVQSEQIDLIATLFNYSPEEQEVFVYMYGVEHVCSEADPEERSERKVLRIAKHSSQSVVFPIIPLKTGTFPFKIIATTPSGTSDIVEQTLNVVSKGRPVTDEITFSLDPMNHQRRNKRAIQTGNLLDEIDSSKGIQRSIVRLTPSRDSDYIVPQTQEYIVSAIGDKLGQTVQTSIIDVENLIRLPHGCGEQVMIYLGPTLYTTRYLSSINKLTGDIRWRAIRYIQSGYKRILNYRKENGAFSAFARRDPSIWLTAFISKMLCQTERTPYVAEEIHVDKTVVNFALLWLINAQNQKTGTWVEANPVYHREMLGGVLKENALTAFVTLTLNECAHHSTDLLEESDYENRNEQSPGDKLRTAIKKAEQALTLDRYKAVKEKNPYVLALTAYALSFSRPQDAVMILNDMMLFAERSQSRNQLYWRGNYQVETAAYALQALMELAPFLHTVNGAGNKYSWSPGSDAVSIVNFLTSKRTYSGAFESTQDTVVALEALSKFAQLQTSPGSSNLLPQTAASTSNLKCNVTINNRTKRSIEFDKDNALIMQTFKLSPSDFESGQGEMLDIFTSGDGLGTMSVKLKYNVFQEDDELCRFNIDSSIEEWRPVIKIPSTDTANDTIDDDYFKIFDESMLKELNLMNPSDPNQTQIKDNKLPSTGRELLRFRRDSPAILELSTRNDSSTKKSDTWGLSKVVSTIKAKLPSIFSSSQRSTTTTTTARPMTTTSSIDQLTSLADPRRLNTSRRSAQQSTLIPTNWSPKALADEPVDIPTDAKLNPLSKDLRINNTTSKSTSLEQEQRLILLLRVCVHHMSSRRDSEMAVLEIGILSGFRPNEADLIEIVQDLETPAMKYEISADRSLIVIYLQYIPSSGPYCIQFRQIRESLVSNLQPGYIRAYEYYAPSHSCANYYTPTRLTDLIKTKCDFSGQVCQCMTKSVCPASNKLLELKDVFTNDVSKARKSLINLVCSKRYDFVAFVSLKNVRYFEAANIYKLTVRVKSDIKGNLTKLMDIQKEQKKLWPNAKQRAHLRPTFSPPDMSFNQSDEIRQLEEDDTSFDYLNLNIDAGCIRGEPLLYHFAHTNHWRQGGTMMILFGKHRKLDKNYYTVTPNMMRLSTSSRTTSFPQPKPNILSSTSLSTGPQSRQEAALENKIRSGSHFKGVIFEEPVQYSTTMNLDKDSILHDLIYSKDSEPRSAINSLLLWLDLRIRHEKWTCGSEAG